LYDIARHYAKQSPARNHGKPQASSQQLALGQQLVQHGDPARALPACNSCHAEQLQGIKPDIPGLTGLRAEYLSAQLGAWQASTRRAPAPDCMAEIAKQLSGEEIQAIAVYIATQDYAGKPAGTADLPQPLPLPCGAVQ
ncbi:MAG: c-type cytochrome, partial [Nevskiales bacterium]